MSIKIGINGMGRIGRMIVRSIVENKYLNIEIKHINNRTNSEVCSNLLKHDSIHGKFDAEVGFDQNHLPYVLTIIIPVYQRTLYLPHLLNSIAESFNILNPSPVQTRPIQCIIMDDAGPEPATQWILKKMVCLISMV